MLISNRASEPASVMQGTTFHFLLADSVSRLSFGVLNLPEVEGANLRVELLVRDAEGKPISEFPKWNTSEKTGTPAKLVKLSGRGDMIRLPSVKFPEGGERRFAVSLSTYRRYVEALEAARLMFSVTAEDLHTGLRASSLRRFA